MKSSDPVVRQRKGCPGPFQDVDVTAKRRVSPMPKPSSRKVDEGIVPKTRVQRDDVKRFDKRKRIRGSF